MCAEIELLVLWCLKPFNSEQIKLFMLNNNIWNDFSECKQMIDTK